MEEPSQARGIVGVHAQMLIDSINKRLSEAHAGRGGLEALSQFLDQVDWVEEIRPLKARLKSLTLLFERALGQCSKEMMARPLGKRYFEITEQMGFICPKCRKLVSTVLADHLKERCPDCQTKLKSAYTYSLMSLVKDGVFPRQLPEAVMMNFAYDALADAYVDAYKAFGLAMQETAKRLGWEFFSLDPRTDFYLDGLFYGRFAGEQKIPKEEKECLQFLARGNLAMVPFEKAEKLIRLAINVVKFGYLAEVLRIPGAEQKYRDLVEEYSALYDEINSYIRKVKPELFMPKKPVWKFKRGGGYYAPCFKLNKASWTSGQIAGLAVLEPLYKLPVFSKADMGAVQTVYGRFGSGKTFLLSSLICYAFYKRYETALIPLNDKTNSYSLAALPMFGYSRNTAKLLKLLDVLDVEPKGIPTITVTVLRKGEEIEDLASHPPTIFDRVIEVESYRNFTPDFNILMSELKAEAEKHGLSVPAGIIAFRNLRREISDKVYIDVQVATRVIEAFDDWRKGHMSRPMRLVLDEVSYMATSYAVKHAMDKLVAGATITDFLKEARRNNVSVDAATQLPVEIMRGLRGAATNIFFRDLQAERSRLKSPIDVLLEQLQLKDEPLKPIIRDMNVRGALPKGLWFWYHQPKYDIQVVRPAPPTFCIYDPEAKMSPLEIIRAYERETHQKILLKSWNDVKRLEAKSGGRRGELPSTFLYG
ncbi:MAG: hypothetical protein QXR32_07120 [Candidatus Caldarchaeum sp.]